MSSFGECENLYVYVVVSVLSRQLIRAPSSVINSHRSRSKRVECESPAGVVTSRRGLIVSKLAFLASFLNVASSDILRLRRGMVGVESTARTDFAGVETDFPRARTDFANAETSFDSGLVDFTDAETDFGLDCVDLAGDDDTIFGTVIPDKFGRCVVCVRKPSKTNVNR